jgi:hypothetical protein
MLEEKRGRTHGGAPMLSLSACGPSSVSPVCFYAFQHAAERLARAPHGGAYHYAVLLSCLRAIRFILYASDSSMVRDESCEQAWSNPVLVPWLMDITNI